MRYSSIQVTPRMRRRLSRYKLPGMSYEAVLETLLDVVPPEEFRARHRRARADLAAALRGSALQDHDAAADEGRRLEARRLLRMTPGERMEEAFRLFEILRGEP